MCRESSMTALSKSGLGIWGQVRSVWRVEDLGRRASFDSSAGRAEDSSHDGHLWNASSSLLLIFNWKILISRTTPLEVILDLCSPPLGWVRLASRYFLTLCRHSTNTGSTFFIYFFHCSRASLGGDSVFASLLSSMVPSTYVSDVSITKLRLRELRYLTQGNDVRSKKVCKVLLLWGYKEGDNTAPSGLVRDTEFSPRQQTFRISFMIRIMCRGETHDRQQNKGTAVQVMRAHPGEIEGLT